VRREGEIGKRGGDMGMEDGRKTRSKNEEMWRS